MPIPEPGVEDADHRELEDADVGRCRRHDGGDVDGEEDRGGGADPGPAVEAERGDSAQQAASWIAQAPSCAAEARMPLRGSRKTASPARTWTSAPWSAAPSRAKRPLPLRRISGGAIRTTTSRTSGRKLKAKSFWVPEWNRGVVEMMITPSMSRATMFSIVCETSVPSDDRERFPHAAGPRSRA